MFFLIHSYDNFDDWFYPVFFSLKVLSYDFRMICLRFLHGFPRTKASDGEVENEGNLAEFQLIP